MIATLPSLLAHRRVPLVIAVVAVVLALPALGAGLFLDDYTHWLGTTPGARIVGHVFQGDWDLFRFVPVVDDSVSFHHAMERNTLPWWTDPAFRLAFLRPLSSILAAVDYRYLVQWPALLHAENLAIYGGVCFVAALIFRRILGPEAIPTSREPQLPPWAPGLAALLYAGDHTHAFAVVWLAARNAILACLFGFLAIYLHDRARRDSSRVGACLGAVSFALALLAGENGVATLAFLVAHAIFLDRAPVAKRARALIPFAVIVVVWSFSLHVLGYGAHAGDFYADPRSEPWDFARAVALRLPVLLVGLSFLGWTENIGPAAEAHPAVTLTVCLAILGRPFVPIARVLRNDRRAGFFATGMVLSLLPLCATLPNDRMLVFAGLGAFGLLALFIARAGKSAGRWERAVAGAFVLLHAVASPLFLPLRVQICVPLSRYVARAESSLPQTPAGTTVVVVNAPDPILLNCTEAARMLHGGDLIRRAFLSVALGNNDGEMIRADDRTVVLFLREGFYQDPVR